MADWARDYLREQHARMADEYLEDCVSHAARVAVLLAREGLDPWIGFLRDVSETPRGAMHHPLTPIRYAGRRGPTWNVHYVACAGGQAWDPLAGEPLAVSDLAQSVFGRDLLLREAMPPVAVAQWIANGAQRLAVALMASPAALRSP